VGGGEILNGHGGKNVDMNDDDNRNGYCGHHDNGRW